MMTYADAINNLAKFCGKKDLESLTQTNLKEQFNMEQVDVLVLLGGSILSGGDCLTKAINNNIAKKYLIVGGYGHTSASLFENMEKEYPNSTKEINSEAELFAKYLELKYKLTADFLETKSTNCGNNITNLLELVRENNLEMESILLIQDATMQLRMDVTLRKYISSDVTIINYPAYEVEVTSSDNQLRYSSVIAGMWDTERYISLLMGEIPRLTDNLTGYGPKGKDFLVHIDIPENITASYEVLKEIFPDATRIANPDFA
ncbi:ElyC/SanA/YdcF family protein [Vagococcus fluvialis]|uniref:ElyC/SanA/YdcF family protein n=1 Tax=Vagococcus fluvialis TaxID=2738 RepID=UPI003B2287C5